MGLNLRGILRAISGAKADAAAPAAAKVGLARTQLSMGTWKAGETRELTLAADPFMAKYSSIPPSAPLRATRVEGALRLEPAPGMERHGFVVHLLDEAGNPVDTLTRSWSSKHVDVPLERAGFFRLEVAGPDGMPRSEYKNGVSVAPSYSWPAQDSVRWTGLFGAK